MGRARIKADCRADTRGGPWAGIPVCVINSGAYRELGVHARAILIEIVARMNGYNNGSIAVSYRELCEAIGCSMRKVVSGIVQLVDHGFLDVATEGKWKERLAREYRLTFVNTKGAAATNEYLRWTKRSNSGASHVVAAKGVSASEVVAGSATAASAPVAGKPKRPAIARSPRFVPASDGEALISKPYQGAAEQGAQATSEECINIAALARNWIERNGYGAQGRLAAAADIGGSRLSRFLHDDGGRRRLTVGQLERIRQAIAPAPAPLRVVA
jgi:hypothetical protein